MLRITVEMLPKGKEEKSRVIAYAIIKNDGTGSETSGNYDGSFYSGKFKRPKELRIVDFPRKYNSVWNLLWRFLDKWYVTWR